MWFAIGPKRTRRSSTVAAAFRVIGRGRGAQWPKELRPSSWPESAGATSPGRENRGRRWLVISRRPRRGRTPKHGPRSGSVARGVSSPHAPADARRQMEKKRREKFKGGRRHYTTAAPERGGFDGPRHRCAPCGRHGKRTLGRQTNPREETHATTDHHRDCTMLSCCGCAGTRRRDSVGFGTPSRSTSRHAADGSLISPSAKPNARSCGYRSSGA